MVEFPLGSSVEESVDNEPKRRENGTMKSIIKQRTRKVRGACKEKRKEIIVEGRSRRCHYQNDREAKM